MPVPTPHGPALPGRLGAAFCVTLTISVHTAEEGEAVLRGRGLTLGAKSEGRSSQQLVNSIPTIN